MSLPQLGPALLTGLIVYWLYERTDTNIVPLTSRHEEVAETLKEDLAQLIDIYYDRFIHPHEYPSYRFVIPSSRSEASYKKAIHVMINDPVTGELFDYNTLLQVGAHECAHILCRVEEKNEKGERDDHGPIFSAILDRLDKIGVELGLYDPTLEIPERYKDFCK